MRPPRMASENHARCDRESLTFAKKSFASREYSSPAAVTYCASTTMPRLHEMTDHATRITAWGVGNEIVEGQCDAVCSSAFETRFCAGVGIHVGSSNRFPRRRRA